MTYRRNGLSSRRHRRRPCPPPDQRPAYISYIVKEENSTRRFGFNAVISGFGTEYRLTSGDRVSALIADMTDTPKEASLRQGYRVRPPRKGPISLSIGGRDHAILDISVTGIRFIQLLCDSPFRPAEKLACLLSIDGQPYPLAAKVIRTIDTRVARNVAAVFVEMGKDLETVLGKRILLLEREELSRKL